MRKLLTVLVTISITSLGVFAKKKSEPLLPNQVKGVVTLIMGNLDGLGLRPNPGSMTSALTGIFVGPNGGRAFPNKKRKVKVTGEYTSGSNTVSVSQKPNKHNSANSFILPVLTQVLDASEEVLILKDASLTATVALGKITSTMDEIDTDQLKVTELMAIRKSNEVRIKGKMHKVGIEKPRARGRFLIRIGIE